MRKAAPIRSSLKRTTALFLAILLVFNLGMFHASAGVVDSAGSDKFSADFTVELSEDKTTAEIALAVTPAADNVTITGIELPDGERQEGGNATYHATENGSYSFVVYYDETQEIEPPLPMVAPPEVNTVLIPGTPDQPGQTESQKAPAENEPVPQPGDEAAEEEPPSATDEAETVPTEPDGQVEEPDAAEPEKDGETPSVTDEPPAPEEPGSVESGHLDEIPVGVPPQESVGTTDSISPEEHDLIETIIPAADAAELDDAENSATFSTVGASATVTYNLTELEIIGTTYKVKYVLPSPTLGSLAFKEVNIREGQEIGLANVPEVNLNEHCYLYGYKVDKNYYSAAELAGVTVTGNMEIYVQAYRDTFGDGSGYDPSASRWTEFEIRNGDEGTFKGSGTRHFTQEGLGTACIGIGITLIMGRVDLPDGWKVDGYYIDGVGYQLEAMTDFSSVHNLYVEVHTYPDMNDNGIDDRTEYFTASLVVDPPDNHTKRTVVNIRAAYGDSIPVGGAEITTIGGGYHFAGWYRDGVLVDNIYSESITDNVTYEARFSKDSFHVSFEAVPKEGGTVSSGSSTVGYGKHIPGSITATANEGYQFDGWYRGGEKVSDLSAEIITSDAVYEARFSKLPPVVVNHTVTFTVRAGDEGYGTINTSSILVKDGEKIPGGAVSATPAGSRDSFVGWYKGGVKIADLFAEVITADVTYEARFSHDNGGGGGGTTPTDPDEPEKPPVTPPVDPPVTPPPVEPPVTPPVDPPVVPVEPSAPPAEQPDVPEDEVTVTEPEVPTGRPIPGPSEGPAPAPTEAPVPEPAPSRPQEPTLDVEITPGGKTPGVSADVEITPENESGGVQHPEFGQDGEHQCCILHFLLLLAALAVELFFTHSRKKHQEEEFEMRKAAQDQDVKEEIKNA